MLRYALAAARATQHDTAARIEGHYTIQLNSIALKMQLNGFLQTILKLRSGEFFRTLSA